MVSQWCWFGLILAHILLVACEGNQQGHYNYRREHSSRMNTFALLSGTLKTYQRAGCDDEQVTLKCPHGTSIAVQFVQYGKQAQSKELCPRATAKTDTPKRSKIQNDTCLWPHALQQTKFKEAGGNWADNVVEACQKKRQCKFTTSPNTFGGDPCPGVRKYVEVTYKCRPYEFRSKIACENDVIQLTCNPSSRLAIYSASYGRTEYESVQCPQPQGVPEETCLVSYATETVMQICHGKRRCTIAADAGTFGNPCRPDSRMYLKVVFTCVPLKVLQDKFEDPPSEDEMNAVRDDDDEADDFDGYDTGDEFIRESAASPASPSSPNSDGTQRDNNNLNKDTDGSTSSPLSKGSHTIKSTDTNSENALEKSSIYTSPRSRKNLFRPSRPSAAPSFHTTKDMQDDDISDEKMLETVNCTISEKTRVIGFITEWINAYSFITQNQEKLYLYLILGITAGIVLCLGLVIGQLLVQRHRARQDAKFHQQAVTEHTLPNGFTDDISEIDADIDLTTPLPIPTVAIHSPPRQEHISSIAEVVRYGISSPTPVHGTLRRSDLDCEAAQPRSLNRAGNSQYYYG